MVVEVGRHLTRDLTHAYVEVRREVPALLVRRVRVGGSERTHVRLGDGVGFDRADRGDGGGVVADEPVGLARPVLTRPRRVHRLVHAPQHAVAEDTELTGVHLRGCLDPAGELQLELARAERGVDARLQQVRKRRLRARRSRH